MSLIDDLLSKVKGKKKVDVKSHVRENPNNTISRVEHYSRFIKEEREDRPLEDFDDEQKTIPLSDIDEKDYADEENEREIPVTRAEKEAMPKAEPHEMNQLIKNWQEKRDEHSLMRIIATYERLLHFHAGKYKTAPIPYNLIMLEAKRLLIKAVDTYKPDRGAAFTTHLTNYLKKLFRFVGINQNLAKIPEQRIRKINIYKTTTAILEDKLGRAPTDAEMADELSWSIKEVQRLRNELNRSEILNFGQDYDYGDLGIDSDKIPAAIKMVYYDGTKEEQFVLEHTTNIFGKKQYGFSDLAKKLKMPEGKVKNIMSNLNRKIIEVA